MRNRFFSGLALLLPISITLWVIKTFLNIFTTPFELITEFCLIKLGLCQNGLWVFSQEYIIPIVACILIICFLVGLLLLVGYVGNRFIVGPLFDSIFLNTPLIGKIYKSCRDLTKAMFSKNTISKMTLCFSSFPTQDQKVLCLTTNSVLIIKDSIATPYKVSFQPTAPNPTVGFVTFTKEKNISNSPHISSEAAFRFIISCGMTEIT